MIVIANSADPGEMSQLVALHLGKVMGSNLCHFMYYYPWVFTEACIWDLGTKHYFQGCGVRLLCSIILFTFRDIGY